MTLSFRGLLNARSFVVAYSSPVRAPFDDDDDDDDDDEGGCKEKLMARWRRRRRPWCWSW